MSATDELRRLLDERGVEYDTHGERYGTWYDTPLGGHVYVPENNAGWLHVRSDAMTPEQAIAATLGNDGVGRSKNGVAERGRLTADDVRDLIEWHSDASGGNGRDFHNGAYVAIADELNATLGRGTCRMERADWDDGTCTWGCICSGCGEKFEHETGRGWHYCPKCGAEVAE